MTAAGIRLVQILYWADSVPELATASKPADSFSWAAHSDLPMGEAATRLTGA